MGTPRSARLTPGDDAGGPGADTASGVAPLPALPVSEPVPAGVLAGTIAW